jgi:hypothetical protein
MAPALALTKKIPHHRLLNLLTSFYQRRVGKECAASRAGASASFRKSSANLNQA